MSEPEQPASGTYTPSDQDPLPSGLIPAERIALTVARAQLERGENPPINITTVLVMTIDRLLEALVTEHRRQFRASLRGGSGG